MVRLVGRQPSRPTASASEAKCCSTPISDIIELEASRRKSSVDDGLPMLPTRLPMLPKLLRRVGGWQKEPRSWLRKMRGGDGALSSSMSKSKKTCLFDDLNDLISMQGVGLPS